MRKQAQVLAITGDKAQVMDLTDYSNFEIDIPEDMKGSLAEGAEVTYYEVAGVKTLEKLR